MERIVSIAKFMVDGVPILLVDESSPIVVEIFIVFQQYENWEYLVCFAVVSFSPMDPDLISTSNQVLLLTQNGHRYLDSKTSTKVIII